MNAGARIALGVAAAALLSIALDRFLAVDRRVRNYELFAEMAHSPASQSFSGNPLLPGGATQQPPPPGTIARGSLRFLTAENPFLPTDAAAAARGSEVFRNHCQVCHGPKGEGDGPVVARGVPAPPPLTAKAAVEKSDAELFRIVTSGGTNMPPYGPQVSPEDRWKAILFIRNMQGKR